MSKPLYTLDYRKLSDYFTNSGMSHEIRMEMHWQSLDTVTRLIPEINNWTDNNIGPYREEWLYYQLMNYTNIYFFKTVEQAMLFKLRWHP